jgi:hypothetical protein
MKISNFILYKNIKIKIKEAIQKTKDKLEEERKELETPVSLKFCNF